MLRRSVAAALALVALAAAGCGDDEPDRAAARPADGEVIRIGTKDFTEQFILGELYRQALAAKGFEVELKSNIGSTEITHQALTTGGVDMYPEYLGVLLSEVAKRRDRPGDSRAAYRIAKAFEERRGYTLLAMTPFSDQNVLVVTPTTARRERLRTIGDLKRLGRVRIGAPPEFRTRFEGLVGLRSVYGLDDAEAVPMPIGEQYDAVATGRVDAAAAFSTAGQLADSELVLLDDPRRVFATQRVAPIISRRTLRTHGPGLARAVDAVSRTLTTDAMRKMNAAVEDGQRPAAVARAFLSSKGLR